MSPACMAWAEWGRAACLSMMWMGQCSNDQGKIRTRCSGLSTSKARYVLVLCCPVLALQGTRTKSKLIQELQCSVLRPGHSEHQYLQHARCSPVADEEDLRQPQVAVEQALLVGSVADDVGYHYEKNGEHLCPHAIYPHCAVAQQVNSIDWQIPKHLTSSQLPPQQACHGCECLSGSSLS